jgi:hypothetical protein
MELLLIIAIIAILAYYNPEAAKSVFATIKAGWQRLMSRLR